METIKVYIEGSGVHELPGDTPAHVVQEYVQAVNDLTPAPKTNGHATRKETGQALISFLAGE